MYFLVQKRQECMVQKEYVKFSYKEMKKDNIVLMINIDSILAGDNLYCMETHK